VERKKKKGTKEPRKHAALKRRGGGGLAGRGGRASSIIEVPRSGRKGDNYCLTKCITISSTAGKKKPAAPLKKEEKE